MGENRAFINSSVPLALLALGLAALFAAGSPGGAQAQTELGSADDLGVYGVDGTALDPDVKIKGFTVFGATQAAYAGAVIAPGNVAINGALSVSSGAYFVGDSTFTAADKLFINDGAAGQLLGKSSAGSLQWTSAGALGDNLGSHVATTTLQLGAYGVNTTSAVTSASYQIGGAAVLKVLGGSLLVGPGAGSGNLDASNTFVGYNAGPINTTGGYNSFLGFKAGFSNVSGSSCTYIGADAGRLSTGDLNSFLGASSGFRTAGGNNSLVGALSGLNNLSGSYNAYLGAEAGKTPRNGSANTLLGAQAGYGVDTFSFSSNTAVGYRAGYGLTSGGDNILVGWQAGDSITTGGRNIVVGYNQDTSSPGVWGELNIGGLLYGDLVNRTVGVNILVQRAALDVVSTGTAANVYAQIWRDGSGVVVASMTSQGRLYADVSGAAGLPAGAAGDSLGTHVATQTLNMAAFPVVNISAITMLGDGLRISTSVYSGASGIFISTGGAIQTTGLGHPPSGSPAAGGPRGMGAVDLQTARENASQVASGMYSAVLGGSRNTASGQEAVVSGGAYNTASGLQASVGGGQSNIASGTYWATIGGGYYNTASGDYYATVGGGEHNVAGARHAVVGGGEYNTAGGMRSVVPGGSHNTAMGDYSFAAGRLSSATAQGAFALSDSQGVVFEVSAADRFGARFQGGYLFSGGDVGIGTVSSGAKLEVAGQIKITGGAPGAGKVLTSDAAGLATWGTAAGDNLGNHTATTQLKMGNYAIYSSSDITAARYQINGSTVLAVLPGTGSLGVGVDAGRLSTQDYNSFFGYNAGRITSSGGNNTFIGSNAGYSHTTGFSNAFVGSSAGVNNTTGNNNSLLGDNVGRNNTTGNNNSFVGYAAGYYTQTGSANTILGGEAGGYNGGAGSGSFSSSTIMGYQAGNKITSGSDNILLGFKAGYTVTTGTGNIIIGYNKDSSAPGASNELNIGGVLYGNLSDKTVGISTRVPQAALDIVSTGTLITQYAQIWRASNGTVVASMTATGVLYPAVPATDNTKVAKAGDTMTGQLTISGSSLTVGGNISASTIAAFGSITAARYQINGSTVLAILGGIESLGIGPNSGRINQGDYNVFAGQSAGNSNVGGGYNSFLGAYVGSNANASYNSFFGAYAGFSATGGYNTFLGADAGRLNTTGWNNSFVGYGAGKNNTTGRQNSFLGYNAGWKNGTGWNNSGFGAYSTLNNQTGWANAVFGYEAGYGVDTYSFSSSTLMGYRAGYGLSTGSDNILLGFQAGDALITGARNVIIGYDQDASAPSASNELNIGGVIYGDLSAKTIGISTRVPQAALDIVSTGTAANVYAQIWRDSTGLVVASMTATGVLYPAMSGADNTKVAKAGDTMTGQLTLAGSTLTVA
ncbi:MAG: hypothetical protein HY952_07160, partial [Elusimicrobia bacterium]|nr:hypothetical protein [Elusimicrobiota bacterium]